MRRAYPVLESRFDAIIFDFDGVIVESTDLKTQAFRQLFGDRPKDVDAIVALHKRHEGVDRMEKFDMIYREILEQPLSSEHKAILAEQFSQAVLEQVIACPMVAGAAELLSEMRGRLPMAVASGTPESELHQIICRRNLSSYFMAVRGSPPGKDKIVASLLREKKWKPNRVLFIGDAMTDYEAARENGISFVGRVASGRMSYFPLATVVISDLTSLEAALDQPIATSRAQLSAS